MDQRFYRLTPDQQHEYLRIKEGLDVAARRNPLLYFHSCPEWCGSPACPAPKVGNPAGGRPKQHEYMAAMDRILLEAAGNRFGKTTANVVWALIQHTPDELLPERLRGFKRPRPSHWSDVPVAGRYVAPSEKALLGIVLPELQRWLPQDILRGGRWDKAYTDKYKVLHFHDGGRLEFYTSEQEAKVMVGTSLDYCIFDEPTTKAIWGECWMRLTDKAGQARFGLTPVNMVGGGIGWLYRTIYKPGLSGEPYKGTSMVPRVLRGTIHDNPDLDAEGIAEALAIYDDDEREARETGEFVAFGGLVYPRFKRFIVPLDPEDYDQREMIQQQSVVVGIDPSYRRAAFVWVAFNDQNQGLVFHVEYVKKGNPLLFKAALERGNTKWDLQQQPFYVMDPYAGGQHSMISGQAVTIKTELSQMGIYTHAPKILDSNAIVYGGVQNILRRMGESPPSFAVGSCVHPEFILESEEYRTEDREDGVFQVVKEFDDGMDGLRYAFTTRPWYPRTQAPPPKNEGWRPGQAPNWERYNEGPETADYPSATGSMF
jgi:hypothetical protein